MARYRLKEYFAPQAYKTVNSVLLHTEPLAADMRQGKKLFTHPIGGPGGSRLSELALLVKQLAPEFHSGTYDHVGLARRILAQRGETPSKEATSKLAVKVRNTIYYLKTQGQLAESIRPSLGEFDESEVEKHMGLVRLVLTKGHRFCPRNWGKSLTWEEAKEAGRNGIMRALSTKHDPSKGAFSTYACVKIASAVKAAVRKAQRLKIHEEKPKTEAQLPASLDRLRVLVKSRKASRHQIGVFALHEVHGIGFRQISRSLGVQSKPVQDAYSRALELVAKTRKTHTPYLKLQPYPNFETLLRQASEISEQIKAKSVPRKPMPKLGPQPLTAFHHLVAQLAPLHITNRGYSTKQILKAILEQGKTATRTRVLSAVTVLTRNGNLPQLGKRQLPRLRFAPPAEVDEKMRMVHGVLKKGHPWMGQWREVLTYPEAVEAGREGLHQALETFDEKRGTKFLTHAFNRIASRIGDAVRQKVINWKRLRSLETPSREGQQALIDRIQAPSDDHTLQESLTVLHSLHTKGEVDANELMMFTLSHAFGHNGAEIAKHFNYHKSAVSRILSKTAQKLKAATEE